MADLTVRILFALDKINFGEPPGANTIKCPIKLGQTSREGVAGGFVVDKRLIERAPLLGHNGRHLTTYAATLGGEARSKGHPW